MKAIKSPLECRECRKPLSPSLSAIIDSSNISWYTCTNNECIKCNLNVLVIDDDHYDEGGL